MANGNGSSYWDSAKRAVSSAISGPKRSPQQRAALIEMASRTRLKEKPSAVLDQPLKPDDSWDAAGRYKE